MSGYQATVLKTSSNTTIPEAWITDTATESWSEDLIFLQRASDQIFLSSCFYHCNRVRKKRNWSNLLMTKYIVELFSSISLLSAAEKLARKVTVFIRDDGGL